MTKHITKDKAGKAACHSICCQAWDNQNYRGKQGRNSIERCIGNDNDTKLLICKGKSKLGEDKDAKFE